MDSQEHSKSILCCGSITVASLGAMEKKLASNIQTIPFERKLPHFETDLPTQSMSVSKYSSKSYRSSGTTVMASVPASKSFQNSSTFMQSEYLHEKPVMPMLFPPLVCNASVDKKPPVSSFNSECDSVFRLTWPMTSARVG